MTTGALIFAYDNETISYTQMAGWSADNIRRHLGIPVAVITDRDPPNPGKFNQIIINERRADSSTRAFVDSGTVTWHNTNRMNAYDLTPWDHTLLLDADYVVASADLKMLLDHDHDLLAHGSAYDITACNDFSGLNRFGQYHMPMAWATVVSFRKTTHARLIFEAMVMIREHWAHYRKIYRTGNSVYRNDHALSIALGLVDGHMTDHAMIPWSLASVLPEHELLQVSQDHYRVNYVDAENRRRYIELKNQDFHAMGKKHLGDIVAKNHA